MKEVSHEMLVLALQTFKAKGHFCCFLIIFHQKTHSETKQALLFSRALSQRLGPVHFDLCVSSHAEDFSICAFFACHSANLFSVSFLSDMSHSDSHANLSPYRSSQQHSSSGAIRRTYNIHPKHLLQAQEHFCQEPW